MHSFHHGSGNGFNDYGGNNHENGNFSSKRHHGVGKFSSYAKSYRHTSYDDYRGYSRDNEFSKVNELPQAQEVVEESVALRVKEEISNEEHCDIMRDKNLEKESIEIQEEKRVENKERLVERSCIFDSISIFSKESEFFEFKRERNIYGDLCAISFGDGLFLIVFYSSTCLSSHAFLEDSLFHSGSMFDLSCHDSRVMNNASIESVVVGFGLDGALFDFYMIRV
ncbi:hypothetical protein M9H77_22686 [Catharanthus roseus]|uniref:Uncharacterized protein n=1 Tax=Catharanthus roseus TaxID=4058 RepID=A0ACC0ATU0_CATRO|nr:hypothetical protein M9H77_22686 [Catharanthus roseus]